jgi:hypothetical protein
VPISPLFNYFEFTQMSEPDHSVQAQVSQKFDSFATFKLAMIRWAIYSGQEIKISKTDKKRTVYVCNIVRVHLLASVSFIHKRVWADLKNFPEPGIFDKNPFFICVRRALARHSITNTSITVGALQKVSGQSKSFFAKPFLLMIVAS